MTIDDGRSRTDPTEGERRKKLSPKQIKDLELAGGVEGGMQAGSAGGPGESKLQPSGKETPRTKDK